MRTEITKLFLQDTIEIGELLELADALLLRCLMSDEDAVNWYKFVDTLVAWAKIYAANILVHGDYIRKYLEESAASAIQDCPMDVRPFVDVDAMIAFGLEHTERKSYIYPEPLEGVAMDTWWFI